MSEATKLPLIQSQEIFWVSYTVQPGTRVSHLLERAAMTRAEWNHMNPEHPASKPLQAGDVVWIKDPIATCKMIEGDLFRYTDAIPHHLLFNYDCEQMYGSFKPLRAFTKELRK